jgi:hypothetical protein
MPRRVLRQLLKPKPVTEERYKASLVSREYKLRMMPPVNERRAKELRQQRVHAANFARTRPR